jgi:signal transduction histidine kinase
MQRKPHVHPALRRCLTDHGAETPAAPNPDNEDERLADLKTYDIVDTVAESTYDAITYLASQICGVPIALISIVDEDRQWFKSRVGLEVGETPRDQAFCGYAINDPRHLLIVPDAAADLRFADNPLVQGDPNIRFYAGAPLMTSSGNALGTLCVIDREPRQLTADQEQSLRALSVQVMALLELRRTVRLVEERGRQLEEATRQRDSFMAAVSHEIRTPLTAVIGYIELLREGMPDVDRPNVIDTVARLAADVQHLLEDLLVSSRAQADSLSVAAVPMDLRAQVTQVLEGMDPSTLERITLDLGPSPVTADPARVRQIVRNLVTNALRYGGAQMTIETGAGGTPGRLRVIDDGDGVSDEDRDLIFQPFQQARGSRHIAASVGLGLPISRLLAERMGGSLVYRRIGGRTVFELILPA